MATVEFGIRKVFLSKLRYGLRLICIKSYNDHNFVKIYRNLPKFGNFGKISNLNFPATYHVTTYGRVQERKENYKMGWRDTAQFISNTVFLLLNHPFSLESGRNG